MSTPSTLIAGRYRLVKLLGAGGMGVVWQAWDERLERAVALKMLRTQPELTDAEREIATNRAMREARITAGLHHQHAVTVYDVVEHDGQPCLVMQLIESTPLSVLLTEHGTLTPGEVAQIGAQVSSALAAAHKMRIVHRDVKPGNILITADGSALISDFGISHALGDATITATGLIHGTPAYLAPEVARGRPSSFASDVFSLGSTMYAMLEGNPPFGADKNAIALLHRVARGGYPRPKHAGVLAPLLREMLSADPKRRPGMTAIAASLSEIKSTSSSGMLPVQGLPLAPTATLLDATAALPVAESALAETEVAADIADETAAEPTAETEAVVGVADETVAKPTAETEVVAGLANETAAEQVAEPTGATDRDSAPPEAIEPPASATSETLPVGEGIPTEAVKRPDPRTAVTVAIDAENHDATPTLQAPPGRTVPMDQLTRFEPPTAETEPLVRAVPAPAVQPLVIPGRPPLPAPPDGQSPGSTHPAPRRRRRTGAVVVLVLVVVALFVGAALLFNPFRLDAGIFAGPTPSQTPEPTAATPTPSTTPSPIASTPSPEPVVQPPPPTAEERVAQTLTGYYALIPGDLESAWPTMTADYQQNHAGGRAGFGAFWSAIADVEITDVSASAPDQGQATLTYYYKDGRVIQEVTAFRLVDEGGVLKIAATEVLSSVDL